MNRIEPMDRVMAAYHAVLAIAWLVLARDHAALAIGLAVIHAALAFLPRALRALPERLPAWAAAIRLGYPALSLFPLWSELGFLHRLERPAGHDAAIAWLDRAVFGVHWNTAWHLAMPAEWLHETMNGLYLSYYVILAAPILAVALARRGEAFRAMSFRLMLTYTACFAAYVLFPVYGPREAAGAAPGGTGPLGALMARLFETGDSPGTAFPSSHVAGAMTSAWLSLRYLPRPVGVLFLLGAIGVAFATVYTGNHYAIDAVAGLVYAAILQTAIAPLFARGATETPRPR